MGEERTKYLWKNYTGHGKKTVRKGVMVSAEIPISQHIL